MQQAKHIHVYEAFQGYEGYGYYPEDEKETLYVYVYEDDPRKPRRSPDTRDTIIALCGLIVLLLCIFGLCLLPIPPVYTIQTITLPARFTAQEVKASVAIIPTGSQTYPAMQAHGVLTIYNGSSFVQALPSGFIVATQSGIEIATDQPITIPGAHLPTPGKASVSAHAVHPGASGNIVSDAIQAMYGPDIEIRNISAFTGGQDTYTKSYATHEDQQKALDTARQQLTIKRPVGLLARPCTETVKQSESSVSVSWQCQYAMYQAPRGVQVLSVHVSGNKVILTVRVVLHSVTMHYVK
ncbi:MAG TPA: hypothetical protein VFV38_24355 [Ktedonobacteraceae bacterium]|nr:hypothetical protein [Ktedonobacteraceae bacterium]